MHVQMLVTHHLAKIELLDLLIYSVKLNHFFKRLFLTITIFFAMIISKSSSVNLYRYSCFGTLWSFACCCAVPYGPVVGKAVWSSKLFFGWGFLDFDDQFSGCQWFIDYKRYVNHCKRGGIGVPEKVGGCSPPHPPHSSSLVRLAPSSPTLVAHIERGSSPFPTCCAQYVYYSQYTQK